MNDVLYKNNQKVIGSIVRLNRIKKNMSQKALAKGICVPSYLSRIENGELLPSDDVISILFERLGLKFNDSAEFIEKGLKSFKKFLNDLNFNEFDYTNKIFRDIEKHEDDFITSPLILDYYLVKLARYCSTPERDKFEGAKESILSAFDLLSPKQESLYNFYIGVDILNITGDISEGKRYIEKALNYKENGHCYYWLSYVYRVENNPIKAYDSIKRALALYVEEGNFISIMESYEKTAEVYFMLDNHADAINYLKMSLRMAEKIKNSYYIEYINSMLAWSYFKIQDYNTSFRYLKKNSGLIDHRMIIPDSVIECLIYFTLEDRENLKNSITKLDTPQSLEHISKDLASILFKLFNFYIENENYIKSPIWEGLLIYIVDDITQLVELRKVFISYLKEYYIHNRRYKDALFLK
ncbi:helix-turn-helix transcriptional regulator [Clostridium paraputrificum]|uniref:helix-turn-helix transcriptional regulator n=1 Tax=Clostridium paraputrificum TaxID=29363 RepID=UPI00189C93CC|nr:helix-turn-helix transcriptional regulator [Clostridium paraputrificum]